MNEKNYEDVKAIKEAIDEVHTPTWLLCGHGDVADLRVLIQSEPAAAAAAILRLLQARKETNAALQAMVEERGGGDRTNIANLVARARSNHKSMVTFHAPGQVEFVHYLQEIVNDLLNVVDAIAEKIR